MPKKWVNFNAFLPLKANNEYDDGIVSQPTDGYVEDDFTRNWQTFWAMLLCSIILVFAFVSIKHNSTQLTDNGLIQILSISWLLGAVMEMA